MKQLPLDATNEMIITIVKEFVGLLVEERYHEAYHFLFHPSTYDGFSSPERIEPAIREYLHEDERLTPIEQATGEYSQYGACRENGDVEGTAWFALPINGEWTDLMVTFEVLMVEDLLVFSLEDIHVP